MCGLCGGRFAPRSAGDESALALVRRMADLQRHRGPDDEGFQESGDLVLGFRRLSIIDLDGGHQPVSNEDQSVWVILNGEIYNYRELREGLRARGHRFQSAGDSEVIAHLYEEKGERVFEDLNGMFTVAVIDVRRRRLVLGRDRAGVKPLYYARCGQDFAFASEIKALLEHPGCPRALDERMLAPYLATQYVPGPRTLFAGIRALAPGHRLILDEGREPVEEPYWRLPSLDPAQLYENREAATRDLAALVREAVRMRLVSDVPLGALLSGGLDSSIVVGVMAEHATGPVLTVCVGYEGGGAMDERDKAREVAKHFGTRHHEIVLGVSEALELLPRLVWHNELPVAEPLIVASYALFREARRHVTVVLSGEGADELFGGYRRYRALSELGRWRSLLPPATWAGWATMKGGRGPWADLGKVGQAAAQALPAEALWEWQSVFSRRELVRLLGRSDLAAASGPLVYRTVDGLRDDLPTEEMANQLMGIEIQNRLVDFILGRADKMSMANSLELRTPFLDYRLIEMSRKIPARWKLSATGEKLILREAFRDLLPERARRRGKQAFQSPYASWLPKLSSALVPDSRLVKDGWIMRPALDALRAQWPRSERRAKQLWTVLLLEMWYRIFLSREEIPALTRPVARATPEPVV
jgi:asparagine synthase (glutamine-hydrolysing)